VKVSINAHGSSVELEVDWVASSDDRAEVIDHVRRLWKYTLDNQPAQAGKAAGPAFGITAERRATAQGYTYRMGDGKQPAVDA
jgi:hypothetical protein